MIRDITPRHLALEALHACDDRYRSLAALSPHAIFVYANDTVFDRVVREAFDLSLDREVIWPRWQPRRPRTCVP